jgi:hypothetical protein
MIIFAINCIIGFFIFVYWWSKHPITLGVTDLYSYIFCFAGVLSLVVFIKPIDKKLQKLTDKLCEKDLGPNGFSYNFDKNIVFKNDREFFNKIYDNERKK